MNNASTRQKTKYAESGTYEIEDASEALVERLRTAFRSKAYEPPLLPASATELLALSRKPNVAYAEMVALMEKDPLIAGKVLRIAQSAAYSRQGVIQSLSQAAVRLGVETLTQIFLEVSMTMKVFRAPAYDAPMTALRKHSVATAHVARLVCRHTSIFDDYAFLCGLLHDVGVAACLIVLSERGREEPPIPFEVAWPAIVEVHEEASKQLTTHWNLPPDVRLVVGMHHIPVVSGVVHPVGAAVSIAEYIVSEAGGDSLGEGIAPPVRAMNALGMSDALREQIQREAKVVLQGIK